MENELNFEDVEGSEESEHVQYDIASYPSDLTLSGINEMWDREALVIPKFQRKFVWKISQASLLIDSFLSGLPVPPIFLYINRKNENLVIDGQQRIMSIVYFLNGYFGQEDSKSRKRVFRLKLSEGHPYNNMSFEDLPDDEQRKLQYSTVLRAINIKQLDPDDEGSSAYHIFERLNTGGTPLSSQEIRNCVFEGALANKLVEMNKDEDWRKILGRETPDAHQKDVELLLRLFAFYENRENYEKPMKEFLNKAMKRHRNAGSEIVSRFEKCFYDVTAEIVEHLGEKPFHVRGPLNGSVLESVMTWCLLNYDDYDGEIKKSFKEMKTDPSFAPLTTKGTTDTNTVAQRYALVNKYFLR
ncbi:DUF262 domain-containing protein [Desulfovibrio sp. JC010]|uniref:DUF262 domain-containing protein n=1 Tax=Desulfovibrio sp. JC010 TaxID=2593641 RepID=UPI0013D5F5B9|nr:DUF262 domain-containing protein [Desulfovibrio sp. JC010]NDV26896.1 DUF262 domain-containing protein [Desulfovibrio sp. JC010]